MCSRPARPTAVTAIRPRSSRSACASTIASPLSYRGVEELLFERGVVVSYETICAWCPTFGPAIAAELKRRRPQPRGRWHLDEMFLKMNGKAYYLWRAVDEDGMVLDILVQERRNQDAAEAFLRRVVDGYPEAPRVAVTDKGSGTHSVLYPTQLARRTRRRSKSRFPLPYISLFRSNYPGPGVSVSIGRGGLPMMARLSAERIGLPCLRRVEM